MRSNLENKLGKKLYQSQFNDFGKDNYDEYRFGKNEDADKPSYIPKKGLVNFIKTVVNGRQHNSMSWHITLSKSDLAGLEKIYRNLNVTDKELLVTLLAYKQLGFKKVKLPRNSNAYWKAIAIADSLEDKEDTSAHKFLHYNLGKFDLINIGFNIKLYFASVGIATDFIIEQYAYKIDGKNFIEVKKDDVVFDLGACWGDTALYFSHKTGIGGKVYSFEFIPGNIKLFNINLDLNPHLKNIVQLVEHPVSKKSECEVYYKDLGPGSKVITHPFEDQTGSAKTISIDDFVKQNNITKVDFIKMDIEGAEPYALEGAIETLKKFKPKLAIAIYHSINDFVNIPNWILDLNLGYQLFLDHFTIHAEETVCFAEVKNREIT